MSTTRSARSSATPSWGDGTGAAGRAIALWLAMLVSIQLRPLGPALLMPTLLVVGLAVNLAVTCRWWRPGPTSARVASPRVAAWWLVASGLLLAGFEEARFAAPNHPAFQTMLSVVFVTLGIGACDAGGPVRFRRAAFIAFLVVAGAIQVAVLNHAPGISDVGVASHDSVTALLHGHDPYAITLANPYDAGQTQQFYDPVVVVGDRLDFGYAYLPVSLLASVPGLLLGNVGYSLVVALAALTVLLRRLATDAIGRMLALVPMAMPFTPQILVNQWVEPIPMLLLGVCAVAWSGGHRRATPIAIGLLLATKQYFFFVLPLVLLVRRGLGGRAVAWAFAVAGIVCGIFVVWNPQAFWHSAVWLQLHLPLREDSVSLPVAWARTFGTVPAWLTGPAAIAAGLLVSALVAHRGRGTPTAFCIGTGLSLLASVVASPRAFSNYYALIEVALVIGCITWARDERGPSSPSAVVEVPSGVDRTRTAPPARQQAHGSGGRRQESASRDF